MAINAAKLARTSTSDSAMEGPSEESSTMSIAMDLSDDLPAPVEECYNSEEEEDAFDEDYKETLSSEET